MSKRNKAIFKTAIAERSIAPSAPTAALLLVIRGPAQGTEVALGGGPVDIGREDCPLTIEHDLVSRTHARVCQQGGGFVLKDLDSTNGTFVNDAPVKSQTLQDGDQIKIGKSVIKFLTTANPETQYLKDMFQKVHTDALTGIHNKRYFDQEFKMGVTGATIGGDPLCVIVMDIDFFKKVNDTHGHAAGDYVLQTVATVITDQVRESDVFARVGGEEFAIVLPNTRIAVAMGAGELIRGTVEMTEFAYEGQTIPVTLSMGVAELDVEAAEAPETLYKRADAKLYEAKESGRNQVCS